MRILVNAASANMGGATTYLTNTTRWMSSIAPHDEIIVVVPEHSGQALTELGLPNVSVLNYPYAETSGLRRLLFDQIGIRSIIRRERIDVLFSTTGFGTWISPVPQVLLVRNLAYFDPAFHALYERLGRSLGRNTLRRWLSLISIRRSDYVLFPTQGMQNIVQQWIDVPLGCSEALHYGFEREAVETYPGDTPAWQTQLDRYTSEGCKVLVNVSTYSVQKNLETLIEALPMIREQDENVILVTTTSREQTTDKVEYDALERRARELGVDSAWVELGYVYYGWLGALYRRADLCIFPSITESFGHPMVEAMAFGLPVVAADTAVNREVCGDAGLYFESTDSHSCARQVSGLFEDEERFAEMSESATRRSTEFSWKDHSERLIEIFNELSERASPAQW